MREEGIEKDIWRHSGQNPFQNLMKTINQEAQWTRNTRNMKKTTQSISNQIAQNQCLIRKS